MLGLGLRHCGLQVLERGLARLRPQLHAHGVAFAGSTEVGSRPLASRLEGLVTLVAEERARAANRTGGCAVVVGEDLLGQALGAGDCAAFRPDAETAVGELIAALDAQRARVVLYVRRQDRLQELSYLDAVAGGATATFDQQFPCAHEAAFDYAALAERLAGVAGVADVRVRPVELLGAGAGGFLHDFVSALQINATLDLTGAGDDRSGFRVLSTRGRDVALAMYPEVDTDDERALVRGFLLEHLATDDDQATRVLSDDERRRILDAYSAVNRKLFAAWMPDLGEDAYDSDAATARLAGVLKPPPARPQPAKPDLRSRVANVVPDAAKEAFTELSKRNRFVYIARTRYLASKSDSFMVSFPKCGRTWLRVMIAYACAEHAGVPVRNPMRFTTAQQVAPGLPRILATHDDSPHNKPAAAVMVDKRAYRGTDVILVVRDPRDVIVSLYFHVTRRKGTPYDGSLADFVRDRVGSLASLLVFYDAWLAQQETRSLLVVRYEDMRADAGRELRRVLDFVGLNAVSAAAVEHAVDSASFDRLQRAEREGTAGTKSLRTSAADDPESYKVRRGKVGGYVDYLTADDVAFIDEAVAGSPAARQLGYVRPSGAAGDGT